MPLKSGFGLIRLQADLLWAGAEYGVMLLGDNALNAIVPKGDGETPVMTLPGFAGPEYSLSPLNKFLRANGYRARSWGMGTNKGVRDRSHMDAVVRQLGHRIRESNDKYGRAVSLVGQSLGGLIAREVARQMPDEIDRVITLGTPAHFVDAPDSALEAVADMMALYTGAPRTQHINELSALGPDLGVPPPRVPLISVYSRSDGVTPVDTAIIPQRYLDQSGKEIRENVEITCSHCGMGVNPLVLLTIADRLAADKNDWQPIDLKSYLPEPIKSLYPLVWKNFAAV